MNVRLLATPLLAALVLAATPARAGDGLTLDTVFGKEPPSGRMPSRVSWAPNGRAFLYVLPSQDPDEALALRTYDVASGTSRVWATPEHFGTKRTPAVAGWSPDGTRIAVLAGGDLYVARASDARAMKVAGDVDDARWSPRGDAIAYAHESDLYVAALGRKVSTRRFTRDGTDDGILNGTLDWVYPEELGIEHGFAWSMDGTQLAYLRMDERKVTNFPIVDFLRADNVIERQRYPLAGESNPRVSLRTIDLATGSDRLLYDAAPRDEYVAAFDWLPRAHTVEAEILDRRQRSLRVDAFAAGVASRTLYRQHSSTWVDVVPLPAWLPGGRSVWLLDRATTADLYVRSAGGVMRQIGPAVHVDSIDGVDPKRGIVYASAAYPTRRDASLIAVPATAGVAVRTLTAVAGVHRTTLAPTFDRFVDVHDSGDTPPQADLVNATTLASVTLVPRSAELAAELLPEKQLEVDSSYGPLDAYMIVPPDFDPGKKYPAIVYVYGGPAAPTTQDGGIGQTALYHQLLARAGFIVFSIDGPASQIDSDAHVRLLFHNFGPGSLIGQEIGAKYLATLPYVDASRIGIWGWSFGGYETCYALTHSTLFKAGAAVAPVTDWHFYDSIYTERYMGLPGDDRSGYDRSSVLPAAAHLNGPLLIQHGTSDDNVHMANSMALIQRFILARQNGVLFYPYPRKTHSITGLSQRRSVFGHMLEFWKTSL